MTHCQNFPVPAPQSGHQYLLYAHIPFCESLCPYCSFNRFIFDENVARAYFRNLRDEMRLTAELGYDFKSMYFGGGTPTILVDELIRTIDLAHQLFSIDEVSCETNPNQLSPLLAEQLDGRVQRLSVGVQSFDDDLLKKINRYQRFGSGDEILQRIHRVEGLFQSLNVDMMFNFPGQTKDMLLNDLKLVTLSGANQTTFYPLMPSPSVKTSLKQTLGNVSFEREAEFYEGIIDHLTHDFDLSTVWTFSRKAGGLIDEYIIDYEEYVGLGSGAFSYLDGKLLVNTFSLRHYEQAIKKHLSPVVAIRDFGKHDQMRYRFLMNLFGLQLNRKQFEDRFGVPVEYGLPAEVSFLELSGALDRTDPAILRLTTRGQYLFLMMMREFFSGINSVREQARKALTAQDAPGMPQVISS